MIGKHYVPQAYLRHFEIADHPGFVWLYDKHGGEPHIANIAKVAQSRDYCSPETEEALARSVELPANRAMDKLSRNERLSPSERLDLAYYICATLKRVPRQRRKAQEMYPEVLAQTMAEIRGEFQSIASHMDGSDIAWVDRRLEGLDAAERKLSAKPPQEVVDQMMEPWPSQGMLDAVYHMAWRVLESSGPEYFITSDNPVFRLSDFGLTKELSEISFPLSTKQALHCCWQGKPESLAFRRESQWLVRETNRRLASETERFAFFHEKALWLPQVLSKTHPFLSRIVWL